MSKKKRPTFTLSPEIKGLWLLSLALAILISQISFATGHDTKNLFGLIGHSIGWAFLGIFGISSYFLTLFVGWWGWRLMFGKPVTSPKVKTFSVLLFVLSLSMLLCLIESDTPKLGKILASLFYPTASRFHLGGSFFWFIFRDLPLFNLSHTVNTLGVALIACSLMTASLMILFKISPAEAFEWAKDFLRLPEPSKAPPARVVKVESPTIPFENLITQKELPAPKKRVIKTSSSEKLEPEKLEPEKIEPEKPEKREIEEKTPPKRAVKTSSIPLQGGFYDIPQASLLTNPKKVDQTSLKQNLNRQAEILEETLVSFGIEAKVGQINCGPTITSFEVHPAIGVKVQKIKALENDIALNMEAKSIRIIAPIPGKAAVGIELPNPQPQEVSFREMLQTYQAGGQKFKIPILLGKQVNGDWVMSDLSKMPHCIIAGATGSGKSVCINTIVMSIIMNARPDEIKLVMVDPKKVELTPYTRLPHMLAPVITEPREACLALNWLVKEMEKRYETFKLLGVRNIDSFNTRKIDLELEKGLNIEVPEKLPYIVAIIDELADLMMVSASDIETPIARIAQMARAVGIHLILATQRPSREVITGLIKANFPTRICFKVASRINSQIILDETGGESLLGNGDMLFLPPGTSHLTRAQGAFIRDEDIQAVVKACEEQAPPNYVINSFTNIGTLFEGKEAPPEDALYEQAKEVVLSTGNASTTFLQRKLKLGYARAANLIDQLESRGIVSAQEGAKARKVLAPRQGSSEPDDFYGEDFGE